MISTSSSAFVMLTIIAVMVAVSSLFSGCVAFTTPPPSSTASLGSHTFSPLPNPKTNNGAIIVPSSSLVDNRICSTQHYIINTSRRGRDTSLSMGIRSFIKRKILRRGDEGDGDGDDDDDEEEEDVSLHSILQSPGSAGLMESPLGTDDASGHTQSSESNRDGKYNKKTSKSRKKTEDLTSSSKYVNDILLNANQMEKKMYEDTQERIQRMKGGGMTEEEKAAFLNNALTRTLPKQKPRGPPIRQKIPGMRDSDGGDKSGGGSAKGSLWNTITGKDGQRDSKESSSKDISVASLMMDGKMKNEEAKRRYMESITNPDRFATFSTYQQPAAEVEEEDYYDEGDYESVDYDEGVEGATEMEGSVDEEGEEESEPPASDGADFAQMKRQIAEDRELLNPSGSKDQEKNAARDAVESILSMISSNNDKKKASESSDDDSGINSSNQGSNDHLAARLGQAAEEQENRDKEARLAAEQKKEDEKKKYAELQKRREEEAERKEVARMEKARKIAEKERLRVEEKADMERAEMDARQAKQDAYWADMLEKENARKERSEPVEIKRKKEVIARDSRERVERDVAKDVTRQQIREEERAREDPHEGEILKEAAEAKLRDRERIRDIEAQSAARVSRTVPKLTKEDASVSSFVREQRRKKEEIDRLRKLDEQSLKSLNSPLPSPGKPRIGIPPSPYRAPPRVAMPPPAPMPAQSSSPRLSLASLTMAKKKEDDAASPPPPPPLPSPTPRLNLNDLTRLKKDSDSSTDARQPAKKKPAKRIVRQQVRQQVPVSRDDDDDLDDDNLMRSGAPGLTVADALKQQRKKGGGGGGSSGGKKDMSAEDKAKSWGIDMSRFT